MRLCPWSLALASSIPVLGLESVCPRKGCPWPWIFFVSLALASSLVSSTPPLVVTTKQNKPELKVSIDNNSIKQSHHIKYLRVLIDGNLNWKQQIKEQCSKVAKGSWALNQLKHFVDEQTLRSVYHCLIYSSTILRK